MASIKSLGIHRPSAWPYLMREKIVSPKEPEGVYKWQTTSAIISPGDETEDELVTTQNCVVWSRSGVIQRIFNLELEQEYITAALFTQFLSLSATGGNSSDTNPAFVRSKQHREDDSQVKIPVGSSSSLASGKMNVEEAQDRSDYTDVFQCSVTDDNRALVVVLKTQAHVYFLSGTSHVVDLPFEVEAAFPLPDGVLLQRKLAQGQKSKQTPKLPSVPPNSFTYAHRTSSGTIPSSQALQDLMRSQEIGEQRIPHRQLYQGLLSQVDERVDRKLPRHFCLFDPLEELGIVAMEAATSKKTLTGCDDIMGNDQNFIYISSETSIDHQRLNLAPVANLQLALTVDIQGRLGLWSFTPAPMSLRRQSGRTSTLRGSSVASRRRSSYGPGRMTGISTPVARTFNNGRESFAGGNEVITATTRTLDDGDPGALLDPAFHDPGAPAKSSRRVSSLLARTDLATSHDQSTFIDISTAYGALGRSHRGISRGPGLSQGSVGNKPHLSTSKNRGQARQGRESSDFFDSLSSISLDEGTNSDEESSCYSDSNVTGSFQNLRNGMIFKKLEDIPPKQYPVVSPNGPLQQKIDCNVFFLQPRKTNFAEDAEDTDVVMCLVDRTSRSLLILQMKSRAKRNTRRTETAGKSNRHSQTAIRVTESRWAGGVIDACKVSEGQSSRILVLSETYDGFGELSLQLPGGVMAKVQMPIPLSIHNSSQVNQNITPGRKHEGGLRRVLSQGMQALTALHSSFGSRNVDVSDADGTRHQIEIQLEPQNWLVSRLIRTCDSTLPFSQLERQPILRAWWDALRWLRTKPEHEGESEWTAFVIVIFSMAVGYLENRQKQSSLRKKKGRGGLLRSSSGSTVDLENWDTMMAKERNFGGSLPKWMQDIAWQWTTDQTKSPVTKRDSLLPKRQSSGSSSGAIPVPSMIRKSTFFVDCLALAKEYVQTPTGLLAAGKEGFLPSAASQDPEIRRITLPTVLIALHLLREEMKLDVLATNALHPIAALLAQLGGWLGWQSWGFGEESFYMAESDDMNHWLFDDSSMSQSKTSRQVLEPPSILKHIEAMAKGPVKPRFTTLLDLVVSAQGKLNTKDQAAQQLAILSALTPKTTAVLKLLSDNNVDPVHRVINFGHCSFGMQALESLPEGIAAPLRAAISACQSNPATSWSSSVLSIIDRDDIRLLEPDKQPFKPQAKYLANPSHHATRDTRTICTSTFDVESVGAYDGSAELDRQSTTRMIFPDDQRFAEAVKLVHPLKPPTVRCEPEPDWSDIDFLEAQQELVKFIAIRTLSVSAGRGLLFYSARLPLLTEKFPIHGFTLSCIIKPANTTVTADRGTYTEEKVSWAFFHAGVEAGLSISRKAKGIDTSWILFNKPSELSNRHAGFLLALGLNGHLKSIAKWVAFKYLTPKHTMTSIGLLLGLSASYLGTMDTLITRLLSVHVTRMLPPGAAELNLSSLTQTTGIMGIGLLFCSTQHRRMSEVMLSEMENVDQEDVANPMDTLRDEGYRLAAGFALGYINLGRGKDLKGLHDMRIVERLLGLAVGTRKVDIVHILDKATAAATIAIGLIFMKTGDTALARKIDIPDTLHQFDYVRPDLFLLRTIARHLILWDNISATVAWMRKQLPVAYQSRVELTSIRVLTSGDMSLLNVLAGLCFSIGLRFAGTGRLDVRNLLTHYLDQFIRICRLPALNYDGKLTRITARNCQDAIALAASTVMAGTGDLTIFRRLRSLHGRTDPDTPYGSHLAAHLAVGVLFLGGGTYTFNTSNVAVASLLCAFYPLFPTTVLDNKSHLQAFRHFWVLAAEPRCLIARDVNTHRPISLRILLSLRDSNDELAMTTPCLLPDLNTINTISTHDPEYWRVTVDFANNPSHLRAFKTHQSIYVRRRPAYDAHSSVFSETMQALNDAQAAHQLRPQIFEWVFDLPCFKSFDRSERALVLPPDGAGTMFHQGIRGTVVDDRLSLEYGCLGSGNSERLWNLRVLFAWAESVRRDGTRELGWLGTEVVENLRAAIWLEARKIAQVHA
ncbi:Anaphase-promoting complex subunit 1 [Bachmanniomyces sp. S44760]|nr:Anaphase-promoting complex subunit 1 [Bachmanniomyces sp. S44760]